MEPGITWLMLKVCQFCAEIIGGENLYSYQNPLVFVMKGVLIFWELSSGIYVAASRGLLG